MEWTKRAACRGTDDPDLFFRDDTASVAEAKRICASCPVRAQCLAKGLELSARETDAELLEDLGIWGGLTARERAAQIGKETRSGAFRLRRDLGLSMLLAGRKVAQVASDLGSDVRTVRRWANDARRPRVTTEREAWGETA